MLNFQKKVRRGEATSGIYPEFFPGFPIQINGAGKEHEIYFSVGVSLFITMHFLIECPKNVPLDPRESVLDRCSFRTIGIVGKANEGNLVGRFKVG